MQYRLGTDAGGTYTNAVLIKNKDSAIIDSRELTTFPDFHHDIKNTIDSLNPE
jgi:N-methylhydantoinase A/oxoprolinase/acetone carboxylase beta subunit